MPFASKSQQREARSTGVVAADRTVTSDSKPELNTMGQDKNNLKGGSIGSKGRGGGALTGGSMGKGSSSTLYGSLGKDGSSKAGFKTMTANSSYTKSNTTREKLGRTGETFSPQTRGNKPRGGGMSQY